MDNLNIKFIRDPIKENKKQCHLLDLFKVLPIIRKDIKQHLNNFKMTNDHIIYLMLDILDKCHFRIGSIYTKSIGMSTIKKKHIKINNKTISNKNYSSINFNGKHNIINNCDLLTNSTIIKLINKLGNNKNDNDLIFTFQDEYDITRKITIEKMNELLSKYGNITTKMFRTWKANYYFIQHIKSLDIPINKTNIEKNITKSVKFSANKLYHNTNISRRSYIDHRIIDLYKKSPTTFLNTIRKNKKYQDNDNDNLLDGEIDVKILLKKVC